MVGMTRFTVACLLLASAAALAPGCSRETLLVSSESPRDAEVSEAGAPGEDAGGKDAGLHVSDAGEAICGKRVCACSNGIDDDGDGLIDGADGQCTGAFDDDESSLAVGRNKLGNPLCAGCFFDDTPSAGNDLCRVAAGCLTGGSPAGAPAACNTCAPSDACIDRCLARTPNGCDCFGCCEIRRTNGDVVTVMLDANCVVEGGSVKGCRSCVPNQGCFNPCGTCELCPGKTTADLPAECESGGGATCEGGPVCSQDLPCPRGEWCGFGCCLDLL